MKRLAMIVCALLLTANVFAHPAWGIVIDRTRNIVYFSDLETLWKIDARGQLSVARPSDGSHVHDLAIDASGNVYGADLRYDGSRYSDLYWKMAPDGHVTAAPNHPANLISTHDRDPRFPNEAARHIAADGSTLVTDGMTLKRIGRDGRVSVVAHISERLPGGNDYARLFGIATVPNGDIYFADYANRRIVKITPKGAMTTALRRSFPWSPTGVTLGANGDLYVLEYADHPQGQTLKPRVTRVRDGVATVIATAR